MFALEISQLIIITGQFLNAHGVYYLLTLLLHLMKQLVFR